MSGLWLHRALQSLMRDQRIAISLGKHVRLQGSWKQQDRAPASLYSNSHSSALDLAFGP